MLLVDLLVSNSARLLQVTSENYKSVGGSVNGSGFRPFDMVIPFSFRKGEITGKDLTGVLHLGACVK